MSIGFTAREVIPSNYSRAVLHILAIFPDIINDSHVCWIFPLRYVTCLFLVFKFEQDRTDTITGSRFSCQSHWSHCCHLSCPIPCDRKGLIVRG